MTNIESFLTCQQIGESRNSQQFTIDYRGNRWRPFYHPPATLLSARFNPFAHLSLSSHNRRHPYGIFSAAIILTSINQQ